MLNRFSAIREALAAKAIELIPESSLWIVGVHRRGDFGEQDSRIIHEVFTNWETAHCYAYAWQRSIDLSGKEDWRHQSPFPATRKGSCPQVVLWSAVEGWMKRRPKAWLAILVAEVSREDIIQYLTTPRGR